jgi:hypothetical protein
MEEEKKEGWREKRRERDYKKENVLILYHLFLFQIESDQLPYLRIYYS